jgi:hypothetical protein
MQGLKIYRELIQREGKGAAVWTLNYGEEAQLKPVDPQKLVTVKGLENACAVPLPMTHQLFQLQRERVKHAQQAKAYEETVCEPIADSQLKHSSARLPAPPLLEVLRSLNALVFGLDLTPAQRVCARLQIIPTASTYRVSQSSIDIWGEEKARSNRPNAHAGIAQRPPAADPLADKWPAPHSRGEANQVYPVRMDKQWSVDHMYFNRMPVGVAHRAAAKK